MTGTREQSGFDCKRCGHCCEGSGGIVVSHKDLARLCAHLNLGVVAFEERFGQRRGGKLHVRPGADGHCIFFVDGAGCGVHEAKPDICRAWPYFRGNLADAESFAMAGEFCPGISQKQPHSDFVREGLAYLASEGICGTGGKDEAGALQVADIKTKK